MQTFLPYKDFKQSLECLDSKRLGKQRVEAKQILDIIVNKKGGAYSNHPAVKMWKAYPKALTIYYNTALEVWNQRGFKNILLQKIPVILESITPMPYWLGWVEFHESHQSNLVRKYPAHYEKFFKIENNLEYIWPKELEEENDS